MVKRLRIYEGQEGFLKVTGRTVELPDSAYEELRQTDRCVVAFAPTFAAASPYAKRPDSVKTVTRKFKAAYEHSYGGPQLVGVMEEL